MNSQITLLNKLIIEEMAPEAPTMHQEEAVQWIKALPRIRENIFIALREEIFGGTEKIEQQINLLKAQFKKHKLDEALSSLLLQLFQSITNHQNCHYSTLLYIKGLQTSLIELCGQQGDRIIPAKDIEEEFTSIIEAHLLYWQFNHPAFIKYYTQKIADKMQLMYNLQEQLDYLCHYEKQMKTQPERGGRSYDAHSPDAKSMIKLHIQAELQYLEKKMYGFSPIPLVGWEGHSVATHLSNRLETPTYRIKTTLSVDNLAYLIRLLIEAGAITASPKKDLLLFISKHVETPRTASSPIGYESLLSKYKHPVQSTANSTRALLKKMINIIEENFG